MKKDIILLLKVLSFYSICGIMLQALLLNVLLAAPNHAQEARSMKEIYVDAEIENASLKEVFSMLEAQTNFTFAYDQRDINRKLYFTFSGNRQSMADILSEISLKTSLQFKRVNDYIDVKKINENSEQRIIEQFQAIKVSGTIISGDDNSTIPGVNILVKGTSIGTITDGTGSYTINAPNANDTLVFSSIGYITEEVPIDGRNQIDLTLSPDIKSLQEVVVVGYGTQAKSDVTGALSSISSKEFADQPVTRVDQVLQGRAPGVQVTNVGGAPGGAVRIRVRGANSILGNNSPLYVVDGYVGADFTTINPNDIESIQVLKDASSTAIYGSRGANGVVIITTKRGTKGGIHVNYSGQTAVSEVIGKYNTLTAGEFADVVNQRSVATGTNPPFTAEQVQNFKTNGGTDWQDEIFRVAWSQEHQLGVSGGNDKTTFLVSANYLDQDGIIKNTGFKRYALRSNLKTQVSDKFSFRLNLSGSRIMNHNNGLLTGTSNPVVQALAWSPTSPIYDADGNYTINDPQGSIGTNPVALLYDRTIDQQRTLGNFIGGINYEFIDGLSLDLQYAVNYLNQQDQTFNGNVITRDNPNASRTSTEQLTLQSTNALSYKKNFNKDHSIDAVAVFETQQFSSDVFSATGNNLKDASLKFYNIGLAGSYNISSGYSKWTLLSLLGRVNYSFRDKYLISATVRRDGSSKFQGDNKFSTFPSVAVGWRISEEPFMQNVEAISNLKLRGSWGLTGSQAIDPYATQSTYNTSPQVAFNNTGITSGIYLGNPGNTNLKWETTEQIDIGAELELLEGRISLEGDYFFKSTRDLLLNQPLPGYVGAGNIARNLGEIENKGWELSLTGSIINNEQLTWTSAFNISNVKNTVISVGGIAERLFTNTNVGAGMSTQSEFVYEPGEALGAYWGLKYLGTWKPNETAAAAEYGEVPGDSHYEDINNDGAITAEDFQIIGSGIPRTSAGWNNIVTYKGFTLNVFFQGLFGVDKLNYTRAAALAGGADARQPILADILDRYIPGVNETSDIPAFSLTNRVYTQSTRFMEKGDYIRLKNVSLSYDLPNAILQDKVKLRFFASATNLFTITDYSGIDPESSSVNGADTAIGIDYGSYPNSKTYTFGLNINF